MIVRYVNNMRGSSLTNAFTRITPAPNAAAVTEHVSGNVAALDVDGDGVLTDFDSTVIARHLHGFKANALTAGLPIQSGATRRDANAISKFIADGCVADRTVMPVEVIGPA
ncbi:MAG: hypothetical protein ACRDAM_06480, partial [Casimicrobium sp.]